MFDGRSRSLASTSISIVRNTQISSHERPWSNHHRHHTQAGLNVLFQVGDGYVKKNILKNQTLKHNAPILTCKIYLRVSSKKLLIL